MSNMFSVFPPPQVEMYLKRAEEAAAIAKKNAEWLKPQVGR